MDLKLGDTKFIRKCHTYMYIQFNIINESHDKLLAHYPDIPMGLNGQLTLVKWVRASIPNELRYRI